MTFFEVLTNWDHSLFILINQGLTNSFFDWFFPLITDFHKVLAGKILIPLILFSFLFWKMRYQGLWIGFALILCLGICDFTGAQIKDFVERPRPFHLDTLNAIQRSEAGHFSFPSNHSMNMFCMAIFLSSFFPKIRYYLLSLAALIAFSRVYNGVHFPSDVVGGALFGCLIGFAGALTARKMMAWRKS
jgi:undecaprenyl-diphosphatase